MYCSEIYKDFLEILTLIETVFIRSLNYRALFMVRIMLDIIRSAEQLFNEISREIKLFHYSKDTSPDNSKTINV